MAEHDEFAPALGGHRAQPEPPPPAADPLPPPPETPFTGNPGDPELPPELAAFLGPLGRLAELFAEGGGPEAGQPPRGRYEPGSPDGAIDALLTDALQTFAARLTPALAAFGTIVDAVEEAITPVLDDVTTRLRTVQEMTEAAAAPAPMPEIVDAVPMEEAIPPVDLPPGA